MRVKNKETMNSQQQNYFLISDSSRGHWGENHLWKKCFLAMSSDILPSREMVIYQRLKSVTPTEEPESKLRKYVGNFFYCTICRNSRQFVYDCQCTALDEVCSENIQCVEFLFVVRATMSWFIYDI